QVHHLTNGSGYMKQKLPINHPCFLFTMQCNLPSKQSTKEETAKNAHNHKPSISSPNPIDNQSQLRQISTSPRRPRPPIPYSSSAVKSPYSHIPHLSSYASLSLSLNRPSTWSPTLPTSQASNCLGTIAKPS